jgi:outer membrane protein assembly factor BamE (lipoprotein component of BamABCDE complex)
MSRFGLICAVALTAVAAAGCSPVVATRGNMIEDSRLERIQVGQMTANDVATILGTPTTVSTFDPRTWYYIGQRTEQTAFFEPTVVERRVLKVRFDESGMLESMEELTLEDGQPVEMVDRETPTLGREMTFGEQMLGNLGRFNPGQQ